VGGVVVSGSKGVECSVWKMCTNEACTNGMFVDFSLGDTQDVLHWRRVHALMREEDEDEEEEFIYVRLHAHMHARTRMRMCTHNTYRVGYGRECVCARTVWRARPVVYV
jgi:hypothetical protein